MMVPWALDGRVVLCRLNNFVLNETLNIKSCIQRLWFYLRYKSKFFIPIYRMVCLEVVRPFLKNDVMKLASHFQKNGYMAGNGVFYVALDDNESKTLDVSPETIERWSPHWKSINAEFEAMLFRDPLRIVHCDVTVSIFVTMS